MDMISKPRDVDGTWRRQPDRSHLRLRGIIIALIVVALIVVSLQWLSTSPRYQGAVELTAAARIILSHSPLDIDAETITQAAADGLTSVLDPYSGYLTPTELKLLTEETEGEYHGLGVEIRRREGRVYIIDVMPQSPAEEAGLRPGDRIVSVEGQSSFDLSPDELVAIVRGAEGDPISLTIMAPDGTERRVSIIPRDVSINPFPLVGVTRSGIGYIRWEHFSEGSGDRLAAIVEELRVEETIGLILDLRGNPGGIVSEAVTAASLFQAHQTLVCTLVGASSSDSVEFRTSSPPIYQDPLVIVQDELSSSAAEILAASLRDAGRAAIVGHRSFGKGWVQNVFPLSNGGGLRLSTAYYITPSGARIGDPHQARAQFDSLVSGGQWTGTGLDPDIEISAPGSGPWEDLMTREGLTTEYVVARQDDWAATGVEDSVRMMRDLHRWITERNLEPDGTAQAIADLLSDSSMILPNSREYQSVAGDLVAAISKDNALRFRREAPGILRNLWEERLRHVDVPDPGELEALIDLDPFLSAARDLIEQPERLQAILAGVEQNHP
ncbi:MAG: hypothetical protein Kow0074_10210 [Candidatus Zixiibacteriota bacterium]